MFHNQCGRDNMHTLNIIIPTIAGYSFVETVAFATKRSSRRFACTSILARIRPTRIANCNIINSRYSCKQ